MNQITVQSFFDELQKIAGDAYRTEDGKYDYKYKPTASAKALGATLGVLPGSVAGTGVGGAIGYQMGKRSPIGFIQKYLSGVKGAGVGAGVGALAGIYAGYKLPSMMRRRRPQMEKKSFLLRSGVRLGTGAAYKAFASARGALGGKVMNTGAINKRALELMNKADKGISSFADKAGQGVYEISQNMPWLKNHPKTMKFISDAFIRDVVKNPILTLATPPGVGMALTQTLKRLGTQGHANKLVNQVLGMAPGSKMETLGTIGRSFKQGGQEMFRQAKEFASRAGANYGT